MSGELLVSTERGLYCKAGDFYVDPWQPVPRAIVTHAHADHASAGSGSYLTSKEGENVLRARLGPDAVIDTIPYGESLAVNAVRLSLHPAGHVLGSAQLRLESAGQVWVVSGDYKTETDSTCTPFEPLRCHTFVTESTFGLPIFRWSTQASVFEELNQWWRANAEMGRVSLVYAYSLGKAQRILAGLDGSIGPIYCHGAVQRINFEYRRSGIVLPATHYAGEYDRRKEACARAIVLAPPSARATPWLRRFGDFASAFASGWMQIRGARRRRAVERGFVLSDHADWSGLLEAIHATQATRVLVTHGSVGPLIRWLREQGLEAGALPTAFVGEQDEVSDPLDDRAEEPIA